MGLTVREMKEPGERSRCCEFAIEVTPLPTGTRNFLL